MERYFYRHGERVGVTELEGVLAVRLADVPPSQWPRLLGDPATAGGADGQPSLDIPEEEAAALSSVGWILVRPAGTITEAVQTRELPATVRDVEPVYQLADGHLLIGTRRLIVQFSSDISEELARARLAGRGLVVVREFRFAPNQFEVCVPAGADPLEVANALQESTATLRAEPAFVEYVASVVPHRAERRPSLLGSTTGLRRRPRSPDA